MKIFGFSLNSEWYSCSKQIGQRPRSLFLEKSFLISYGYKLSLLLFKINTRTIPRMQINT